METILTQIDERTIQIPVKGGKIDVIVSQPKQKGKMAAYIWAHGGAGVAGTADQFRLANGRWALTMQCIVFNVDFRLAPEHKMPTGVFDFHAVIKYVVANAESLSVEKSKVCIGGYSGGSMLAAGAAYELARTGESNLVHSVWLKCPMLSHEYASVTYEELNQFEKPHWVLM